MMEESLAVVAPSENALWGNEVAAVAPDRSPGRNGLTQDDASAYDSTFLFGFLTESPRAGSSR